MEPRSFIATWLLPTSFAFAALAVACSSSSDSQTSTTAGSGGAGTSGPTTGNGSGGALATTSTGTTTSGPGASTGTTTTGGSGGDSTSTTTSGSGGSPPPPATTCPSPISAVDVSTPTTVVGTGTAASCTEAALTTALTTGGIVTFNCGAAPITIKVTSEKALKKDTVIDGGGLVTLSGGGTTRILHLASAWDQTTPKLTVQHLAFTAGFTTDAVNTKATNEGGAEIFREGGSLDVFDCQFSNGQGPTTGQDVSGGAITSQGVGNTVIVGSTFKGNSASDGGAVGNLGNGLTLVNDTFDGNSATGTDGNPGNGGNGGAVVFDGAMTTMSICGCSFTNNKAGAQGGALFRVAYTDEPTNINLCTFDSNSADATVGLAGAIYLEDTTINMTATTISANKAHYGGGIWVGQSAIANLTNVTIANNTSDQGGGMWFANAVTGTFLNVTIAGNKSGYGDALFAGSNGIKLVNSVIDDNGCKGTLFTAGSDNIEFGGNAGCSSMPIKSDPLLGTLQDNGGPTKTMLPAAGSPAIGKGMNCPATDQRGTPRTGACTLGAVEAG